MRTSEERIRKELLKLVEEKQGCKAIELVVTATKYLVGVVPDDDLDKITVILEQLVQEDEVLEVEFVLPMMNWRCKSFLLPKGTDIRLSRGVVVQPSNIIDPEDYSGPLLVGGRSRKKEKE